MGFCYRYFEACLNITFLMCVLLALVCMPSEIARARQMQTDLFSMRAYEY